MHRYLVIVSVSRFEIESVGTALVIRYVYNLILAEHSLKL